MDIASEKTTSQALSYSFNHLAVKMQQLEAMLEVQSGDNTEGWSDMTQSHYREACLSMMVQAREKLDSLDQLIHG